MKYPVYSNYQDSEIKWLGEIPMHWVLKSIKYVASYNDDVLPENTPEDYELQYVDISSVDAIKGVTGTEQMLFKNAPSRARRKVQDGDVIVSTVRTYLRAIASIRNPDENLIVSTGFAVVRPKPGLSSRYAGYLFGSEYTISEVISRSVGVSYPAVNASELAKIKIPVPPLDEQIAIADFLDCETAQIDALIAKQEEFITQLQEKRQALISHAVTNGLNPTAPKKDSGVDWLGEIPSHWEIRRNKNIFLEVNDRSETGDEELLSVSHITGVTPRSEKNVNMFLAESMEGYKRCLPGDLIINTMWAYMGALGLSDYAGIVSPSYNVYRLREPDCFNYKYLDYLYRTPRHIVEIGRYSKGVWESRLRLYPTEFFSMMTPVPPREEQDRIVDFITTETNRLAVLEEKCHKSIAVLQERRSALITAAVTGQIDVRSYREDPR